MLFNIFLGFVFLVITLIIGKLLLTRYRTHWKTWVGVGWVIMFDDDSKKVTIKTYLLDSPAGRAEIKRGSVLLTRDGVNIPAFENKEEFVPWFKSFKPEQGKAVKYTLLEPGDDNKHQVLEVTLKYEKLRGSIPTYAPLPTSEEIHQDWKNLMPNLRAVYPTFTCPRTGVLYHRRRLIPVEYF